MPTPLPYSYRDLNLIFTPNPITSDISAVTDVESINQAVRNLIFTDYYDRLFHPEIGSGVRQSLFEPFTSVTSLTMEKHITNVITNYEPRVTLIDVSVVAQETLNGYTATITYNINNIADTTVLDVFLERVR